MLILGRTARLSPDSLVPPVAAAASEEACRGVIPASPALALEGLVARSTLPTFVPQQSNRCLSMASADFSSSSRTMSVGKTSRIYSARLVSGCLPVMLPPRRWLCSSHKLPPARNGAVIRADVHVGPDGRPKGSGIVVFENPDDARNAIAQFNGYDWQGRPLEVREDRYAGAPPMGFGGPRGGFGGGRGGFGGFGGRGGFVPRGGFGGGFGGRGGFGGGAASFDPTNVAPPAQPNPFTDFATAGGEQSEIIYVKNVRNTVFLPQVPPGLSLTRLMVP